MITRNFFQAMALGLAALLGTAPVTAQAEIEMAVKGDGERMQARRITAEITAINPETRELTLQGPLGNLITIVAGPEVARFDEFAVGDMVVATYVSSLSGELREPTEEEKAEPLVVLDAQAAVAEGMDPGVAAGLTLRAVCTVEGMNRLTRTVMLKDPDGDFHIIEDVDPAKMAGVTLGDTVIVTYTQAFALTLEKHNPAE